MTNYQAVMNVVLGLLLRLGIPVVLMIVLVLLMRRIDQKWKEEAERERVRLYGSASAARNTRCWDVKKCSEECKAKCTAYARQEVPCWQLFRDQNGVLRESCLGCNVFREAPIPILVQ